MEKTVWVFDRNKYIKVMYRSFSKGCKKRKDKKTIKMWVKTCDWANKVDGQEVQMLNECSGVCGCYYVHKDWCKVKKVKVC